MDELHPLMLHDIIKFLVVSSTMLQLHLAKGLIDSSMNVVDPHPKVKPYGT